MHSEGGRPQKLCVLIGYRVAVIVMPCCQGAVAVVAVERNKCVLGKHSGIKYFVLFTNYWMLLMKMWNLVCKRCSPYIHFLAWLFNQVIDANIVIVLVFSASGFNQKVRVSESWSLNIVEFQKKADQLLS